MGDLGTITIHVAFTRFALIVLDPGHRQRAKPGEEPGDLGKIRSKAVTTLRGLCSYLILP